MSHDLLQLVAQTGVRWQAAAHAVSARFGSEGWAWASSATAPAWRLAMASGAFSLGAAVPAARPPSGGRGRCGAGGNRKDEGQRVDATLSRLV